MNSQTIRTAKTLALAVCAFGCMVIISPANLRAQSTFGSIRGTAQDQTGGALPQVQITLHNVDENADVATISDGAGNFLFENVRPGHYRLNGAKEGFAIAVVDKLDLAARQDIRLDVKFVVAATNQQIEVAAETAAVNTENATLTDSKTNGDITQLPINSRAVSGSPLSSAQPSASRPARTWRAASAGRQAEPAWRPRR